MCSPPPSPKLTPPHPRFVSTGICTVPEQRIHSCQNIGSQFLISNQKFNVTYKKCDGMEWTKDAGWLARATSGATVYRVSH